MKRRDTTAGSAFAISAIGVLLAVLSGQAAFGAPAAERTMVLQWRPVRGAFGYVMEVRDAAGRVETTRVTASQVELRLKPGEYSIRLAGLNKFRKPGIWSDWRAFRIAALETAQPARLNLEKLKTEAESKSAPPERADIGRFSLRPAHFVPGLPQWQAGSLPKGAAFGALFAGAAFYAYGEARLARTVADAPTSNSFFWIGALSTITVWDNLLVPGLLMRQKLVAGRVSFDEHRANYRAAAGVSVLVYLVHLADAVWNPASVLASSAAPGAGGIALGPGLRLEIRAPLSARENGGPGRSGGRWSAAISARF